jgi:hypothetical protein
VVTTKHFVQALLLMSCVFWFGITLWLLAAAFAPAVTFMGILIVAMGLIFGEVSFMTWVAHIARDSKAKR